jgi:YfiH family protein
VGTDTLARLKQVHGTRVHYARKAGFFGEGDGFISDKRGIFLAIHTADCMPVFIYEPNVRALALLHAGWRGITAGIIPAAIDRMKILFSCNAGEMIAAIGPHIHKCCYSVGKEVAEKFTGEAVYTRGDGVYMLDLSYAAAKQLTGSGIPVSHVELDSICTSCEKDMFYSHRRDNGHTGRMMALFGRK